MDTLTITTDPAATYQAALIVEPAAPGWLHLPSLYAKLLPLALQAGHEKLGINCEVSGTGPSDYTYTAYASGGASGYREYIGLFTAGGGYSYHDFERVLTEKLQQQIAFRQTVKGGQQDA